MTENAIAKEIVDAAFRIHTTLGPGLLESVYQAVLAYELAQRRLRTVSQQPIPVVYGTIRIDIGFRADLIVEDQVIVEVKSVEVLVPVHKKQLLTYLEWAPFLRQPVKAQFSSNGEKSHESVSKEVH